MKNGVLKQGIDGPPCARALDERESAQAGPLAVPKILFLVTAMHTAAHQRTNLQPTTLMVFVKNNTMQAYSYESSC